MAVPCQICTNRKVIFVHLYKNDKKEKVFSNLFPFRVLIRVKEVMHAGICDLHFTDTGIGHPFPFRISP